MNTKLILLEDVEDLGYAGDTVSVAAGYARNYLLPKGLAAKASPAALRQVEARREKIEAQRRDELKKAQDLAARIAEVEISIPMQAGDDNRLFGSVTAHMIAEELEKQRIHVEHKRIELHEPIKELGAYNVEIKLHKEVCSTLKVWVVRA